MANMLALFSSLAGRRLDIDQAVLQSELATGHRNRAIAYMMLNTAMIQRSERSARSLFPPMLGQCNGARPRDHGRHACQ